MSGWIVVGFEGTLRAPSAIRPATSARGPAADISRIEVQCLRRLRVPAQAPKFSTTGIGDKREAGE